MNIVVIVNVYFQFGFLALLVLCVISFFKKQFKNAVISMVICIVFMGYWIVVRDRVLIIRNKFSPFLSTNQAYDVYKLKYHRYPMSMEEVRGDSVAGLCFNDEYIKTYYEHDPNEIHWALRPFLLKDLEYGTHVWVEDTLVHSVLYVFGFDYDDDYFAKHYNFASPRWRASSSIEYAKYILIPLRWDGDIYIEGWVRSIYDPWFDTTFVRQILEQHGDTLSPEEHKEWLKKRSEYPWW